MQKGCSLVLLHAWLLIGLSACTEFVAIGDLRFDCADVSGKSDGFNDLSSSTLAERWFVDGGSQGQEPVAVEQGVLEMVPHQGSTWLGDERGAFVYQYLCGNFIVVADVSAYKKDLGVAHPLDDVDSGGGLMIRNPGSATNEEWLTLEIGFHPTNNVQGVNARYTRGEDSSQFDFGGQSMLTSTNAKLLFCRVGDDLRVAVGEEGPWSDVTAMLQATPGYQEYPIPAFPNLVQVGVTAMRSSQLNGLPVQVDVDFVTMAVPESTGDCFSLLEPF